MSVRLAIALSAGLLVAAAARAQEAPDTLGPAIASILIAATHPDLRRPDFSGYREAAVRAYAVTGQQPLWLIDRSPTAQAGAVIESLFDADARGLSVADYDAAWLRSARDRLANGDGSDAQLAAFDTALTVAVMRFISDSYNGRIDPRAVGFALDGARKPLDLAAVVLELSRSPDPGARLAALQPQLAIYARLRAALATMRGLAARADLPAPVLSATLRPGDRDPGIATLRTFLAALGDLPAHEPAPADPALYDDRLAAAVRRFQVRHGLDPDGVLGPATRGALAVPLGQRVEQIRLALERTRWLPQQFAPRLLIVNIPAFRLLAFERQESGPRLTMEVVVGSAARKQFTPVLYADLRYIIFGPYWNVPRGIARNEMLPILQRDLGYLARQNLEIVAPGGVLAPTPANVDLVAGGAARLRQRPGPRNALGRVKFMFPNPRNVYLHDTPSRGLFARARRDFSHGCIRVADPLGLAEFVLAGQPGWDREHIRQAMEQARDRRVDVAAPVQVYLLYSTAVVSQTGELNFFDDIYGHDAQLARLLAR